MAQVEINDTTGIATVGVTQSVAQVTVDDIIAGSVEVTPAIAQVTVDDTGVATVDVTPAIAQVTIADTSDASIVTVTVASQPQIIEVGVIGPQGPPGPSSLTGLTDVNVAAKVDKSILYYDQPSNKFIANEINTLITISDGGNF